MQLSVTLPVNSIGAACYGRLAQYTPSLLDRHAGSAKTEKLLRVRPFSLFSAHSALMFIRCGWTRTSSVDKSAGQL